MNLVLLGHGCVGSAFMELICLPSVLADFRKIDCNFPANVTIIEPKQVSFKLIKELSQKLSVKVKHIQQHVTKQNLKTELLSKEVIKNNLVVDCSVGVDAISLMKHCARSSCMYINCSMEDWETKLPESLNTTREALLDRSLYIQMLKAFEELGKRKKGTPTMVSDQGMNPGLISLFAKKGLEDMAVYHNNVNALEELRQNRYGHAARELGVTTIHVSERDTQIMSKTFARKADFENVFYNTWSCIGLAAEALDPVQIGRGTHEANRKNGEVDVGNVRILPQRGIDVTGWSYSVGHNPNKPVKYSGLIIPHGEANTLSQYLTVRATSATPTYRPSVYFVYNASPIARRSLTELKLRKYNKQPEEHVLSLPEIAKGYDSVGALLFSSKHGLWWSGTVLSCSDVKRAGLVRSGPTAVQVAIALVSTVKWMLKNPRLGYFTPEYLPHSLILEDCRPFLGKIHSCKLSSTTAVMPRCTQLQDFMVV